jgi:alginate O-acetyltransferase complex protein AlgI
MTTPAENQSNISVPSPRSFRWAAILALLLVTAFLMIANSTAEGLVLFAISVVLVSAVTLVVRHLQDHPSQRKWLAPLIIALLIGILIFSRWTRLQVVVLGSPKLVNSEWLGLSYLILRLIHMVVDSHKIPLPTQRIAAIADTAAYALFPSALIAGPIHRADKFLSHLASFPRRIGRAELLSALERIGIGFIKKFIIADFLRLFALDSFVVNNPNISTPILWLTLIAFGFMLYFDFAGYSDIAIGTAALIGLKLPENFANPYAQPNITNFWQSWHISLSNWLRDYIFIPLSRTLLKRFGQRFSVIIMAVAHLTTMILAGLWHALTLPFILWGAWHGVGLFIHAQWSRLVQQRGWTDFSPRIGLILTFLFVNIGWVFFALPDVKTVVVCFTRLIGR